MEAGGYTALDKTETLRDCMCSMTKMRENDLPLVHTDQGCQVILPRWDLERKMVGDLSSGEECWPGVDVESGVQVMPVAVAQQSGVQILSILPDDSGEGH
ncbi:hypothetical protein PAXRUDRAFT_835713 [Paxillus rubicundulus Ve08.2h10]|uniref:Uncharacterized protein n=1 Tax=Paxillus rubicundulus Ve08.2h10 TaxID=930991 RepID=A0A0D0CJF3_9AGAM|nr:hypothetical protein PAXRUDRAFT_835713 [Paxillus rubicundulus Ve08.2h10]